MINELHNLVMKNNSLNSNFISEQLFYLLLEELIDNFSSDNYNKIIDIYSLNFRGKYKNEIEEDIFNIKRKYL